jgi:hypothetical protein
MRCKQGGRLFVPPTASLAAGSASVLAVARRYNQPARRASSGKARLRGERFVDESELDEVLELPLWRQASDRIRANRLAGECEPRAVVLEGRIEAPLTRAEAGPPADLGIAGLDSPHAHSARRPDPRVRRVRGPLASGRRRALAGVADLRRAAELAFLPGVRRRRVRRRMRSRRAK